MVSMVAERRNHIVRSSSSPEKKHSSAKHLGNNHWRYSPILISSADIFKNRYTTATTQLRRRGKLPCKTDVYNWLMVSSTVYSVSKARAQTRDISSRAPKKDRLAIPGLISAR
jgi:hypothetical protein